MNDKDRKLGMDREITRRDFIHDVGLASLGLTVTGLATGSEKIAPTGQPGAATAYYPPTLTGMRGSHVGSFETAHALAITDRKSATPDTFEEQYDLVVVGGGISGLAAAWYYRKQFGADSRILIIDNHDDFGGHAKRNEFHQGGQMRLAWGGAINLEYPSFSDTVHALLKDLGVDIEGLLEHFDFHYGRDGETGPATYFDRETYGRDVLIPGFGLRRVDTKGAIGKLDGIPISAEGRAALKRFYARTDNLLEGLSEKQQQVILHNIGYIDFLTTHGGLTEDAAGIFNNASHGYWGLDANALSVAEAIDTGLPAKHLLGDSGEDFESEGGYSAMFPDGNASIARLLVRDLVPGVADGKGMDDIATARFDYSRLDEAGSAVRLRLNSTVVRAENTPDDGTVAVTYVRDGKTFGVTGRHCVLACYHSIIPYLCADLPEAQKEALSYQVKRPMLVTNVLLKSSKAADKLGISGAYCPGRLHCTCWLVKGVDVSDYQHSWDDDGPVVMQFFGSVAPPPVECLNIKDQHRASRRRMLAMTFEDFEREVRTTLNGMLGAGGFDAAEDILAVTVNRWPHGYAYDYLDLWDPEWPPGEAPHEIARKRFGNIAFANADAGADAYMHVAIDQAWRAITDLQRP